MRININNNKWEYNVIVYDFNKQTFEPYDIFPYLRDCYIKLSKKPRTFDNFKIFIEKECQYQFWSRCEYEIILSDWPNKKKEIKIDVFNQITMNLNAITKLFMLYIKTI